jgi:8-oxo-dGTP pyrophosphatase MutT (NUDIX family)
MYPEDSPKKSFFSPLKKTKARTKRSVVGVIVFDGEKFLLLHRVLNWRGWEYPKGGIDAGEKPESAIGRELKEETGLDKYELVGKVNESVFYDRVHNMDVFMQNFLVRVSSNNKVHFDAQAVVEGKKLIEHDDFRWCFPGEAVELLRHDNSKLSMKKAIKMLGLETK